MSIHNNQYLCFPISLFPSLLPSIFQYITIGIRALFPATMTETKSTTHINESIASLRTTTDRHAHHLQEIMKQLNANIEQLNAISIALQKLTEVEEKRQQPSSPKTPSS